MNEIVGCADGIGDIRTWSPDVVDPLVIAAPAALFTYAYPGLHSNKSHSV